MDTYTSLKEQYYKLIAEALNEPNAEKQQDIIKQILDTNTLLATEIRTYVSEQTQKPNNPEELQELVNELLNIQKEFLKIQETKEQIVDNEKNILKKFLVEIENLKKHNEALVQEVKNLTSKKEDK